MKIRQRSRHATVCAFRNIKITTYAQVKAHAQYYLMSLQSRNPEIAHASFAGSWIPQWTPAENAVFEAGLATLRPTKEIDRVVSTSSRDVRTIDTSNARATVYVGFPKHHRSSKSETGSETEVRCQKRHTNTGLRPTTRATKSDGPRSRPNSRVKRPRTCSSGAFRGTLISSLFSRTGGGAG